jgi:hypothetical protein
MIRGAVTFENQQLDDLIIQRSDSFQATTLPWSWTT